MKKTSLALFATLLAFIAFSQETKVSVKKEKLYVNDNAICIIDKKKKGMLSIPSFEIKTLDEKPLGILKYNSISAPVSGTLAWYGLSFEGTTDTVQLVVNDFRAYDKSMLLQYDEALGKIIHKYNLIKDNALNKEGLEQMKKDYPANYSSDYSTQAEKEKYCMNQLTAPAKSDAKMPVTVVHVSTAEVSKFTTVITYDIMQDGKKIGGIIAKGDPKGAKSEDSEYDYSPGILGLDGGGPLNYDITNAEGCIVARYIGEEKTMGTWKDRVSVKAGELKKHNKEDIRSRLAYMQAIANYLVTKRYL